VTRFVSPDEIDRLTAHHPPMSEAVVNAHQVARASVRELMHKFNALLAECPQKTHLIRQLLPQVLMAANQIIAVHGLHEGESTESEGE
jgi:hypothetical protein